MKNQKFWSCLNNFVYFDATFLEQARLGGVAEQAANLFLDSEES
ncbi:hypothetical protein [Paenibacillus marinisediminis]